MNLGFGLGLPFPQKVGSAPPPTDFAAEVQTLLAGTAGFALDPSDSTTLFQDTAAATPVTIATDPIGRINSKYGTTAYQFIQGTAGFRPIWNGAGAMQCDGVDDRMDQAAAYSFTNNIPGFSCTNRLRFNSLAGFPWGISTPTAAAVRVFIGPGASGEIILYARRLDADAQNTFTSAAGKVGTVASHTISISIDYAGTGGIEVWVDGVSALTGTLANAPGTTSATNPTRHRLGAGSNSGQCNMNFGRQVILPRVFTAGERASMEGYVGAVTL